MKEETFLDEDVLIHKAVNALMKSLGPIETKRFLSLNSNRKRLESVKRHTKWQSNLNRENFLKEVFSS
jgi:hypothetical protein